MDILTREEVLRLARLARLALSDDEVERFTRQLREILEFARQVNAVDTSSIAETISSAPPATPDGLREDVVVPSLDRRAVLDLAPDADRDAGLFKVPRVLGE